MEQLLFTDKQKYAQKAGAAGLLIINNAGGNTPLTSVLYNEGFPTAGLSTDDGKKLVDYLESHPDEVLQVNIAVQPLNNVVREEDLMSDFTSYGPVSNLAFKPDITAQVEIFGLCKIIMATLICPGLQWHHHSLPVLKLYLCKQ